MCIYCLTNILFQFEVSPVGLYILFLSRCTAMQYSLLTWNASEVWLEVWLAPPPYKLKLKLSAEAFEARALRKTSKRVLPRRLGYPQFNSKPSASFRL